MLKTIPARIAQTQFSAVLEQVKEGAHHFAITENDVPTAVMLSADEYQSLLRELQEYQEYFDVLNAQQENQEPLKSTLAELRQTRVNELFEMIEQLHALDIEPMTDAEIEAEINSVRAEKRASHARRS
jgi:PHD/YefM family antitoxin component YafN of YafNO toxin-antitoxin module